jgi:hypothetical protein
MRKTIFESILNKYIINDDIDSVVISVSNNIIKIPFTTLSANIVGYVQFDKFDVLDLEFGLNNHSNFIKNVKIMSDDFDIIYENDKLFFKDSQLIIEYFSQMKETISYIDKIDEIYELDNQDFDVSYIFDKEFVNKFLKIASVDKYEVQDTFTLTENKKDNSKFELKIGKASKIKFNLDAYRLNQTVLKPVIIGTKDFESILSKNKDLVEGYLYFKAGLIKLSFINQDGVKSTYFMPTHDREN